MLPGTPCCFARQDDAPEERLAVATVWPLARCALCCWHVFRNVETRYVRITGHRGDVVWTTIKSHLWTAAHAKQSRKGRLALVTALGTIFNILHKPRVLEYQPHDVVSAMLDAAQLGASQAAEKREASGSSLDARYTTPLLAAPSPTVHGHGATRNGCIFRAMATYCVRA